MFCGPRCAHIQLPFPLLLLSLLDSFRRGYHLKPGKDSPWMAKYGGRRGEGYSFPGWWVEHSAMLSMSPLWSEAQWLPAPKTLCPFETSAPGMAPALWDSH